jgi:lipoate---protein ligase
VTSAEWRVEVRAGPAAVLHASWASAASAPGSRAVALCEPDGPCLVLGSTQAGEVADRARLARNGVALASRRTGGGAVYVEAGDPVWIDVWLPDGDPLADPDVGRSFDWLGEVWIDALGALGVRGVWYRRDGSGPPTRWSSLVCFAGIGRGEVFDDAGRKVVGLAQRRTRGGSWFQSACVLHWDPGPLIDSLTLSHRARDEARDELASVAIGVADLRGPSLAGAAGRSKVILSLLDALP